MHPAQMAHNKHNTLTGPGPTSEPVVAFYLIQETDLPVKFQGEHQLVTIKIPCPSGRLVEKPALRVTFSHDQSLEEPVGLLGLGSDPRCHVQLPADIASPVHCRVYAQLNSGPQAWLVDDSSARGTQIQDDETLPDQLSKTVHSRRQATPGLQSLSIGPYKFSVRAPDNDTEVRRRENWFSLNKPIPVTSSMLARQLGGVKWDWHRMELVGEGGNGKVYKYMEKNTALLVAVKEEQTTNKAHLEMVLKEINFMRRLCHVSCCPVVMTSSNCRSPFLLTFYSMNLTKSRCLRSLPLCLFT